MNFILAFFTYLFGCMFFLTALDKWRNWHKHIGVMEDYKIIKGLLIPVFLVCFLTAELFISLSLFTTGVSLLNLIIFFIIILVYTAAVTINLLRGNRDISCGCGSVLENDRLTPWIIVRNITLMMMYFTLFYFSNEIPSNHLTGVQSIIVGLLALCVLLFYGVVKGVYENHTLLQILQKRSIMSKGGLD